MKLLPPIPARTIRIICIFISILLLTSPVTCLPVFGGQRAPAAEVSPEDSVIIATANDTSIPKSELSGFLNNLKINPKNKLYLTKKRNG